MAVGIVKQRNMLSEIREQELIKKGEKKTKRYGFNEKKKRSKEKRNDRNLENRKRREWIRKETVIY